MAESDADRQRAYRERKRVEARETLSVPALVAEARAGRVKLTGEEEQRIRDHFDYAPSEKRTLAERDETARRMSTSLSTSVLDKRAFPHVEGRDDPASWSLDQGEADPRKR